MMSFCTKLCMLLMLFLAVSGKPYHKRHHPTSAPAFGNSHLIRFTKIKDLIDSINIKEFRRLYNVMEKALEEEDNLTEIDLTEDAIKEDRVIPDEVEETSTTVATEVKAAEEITTAPPLVEPTTSAAVEETTTAAVETVQETTAAAEVKTVEEATTVAVETKAEANVPDEAENEIVNEFFVSEDTLAAAKKFGYKILLRKINGENVPVGKIRFSFPTYVEIEQAESGTTEQAQAATTAAALAEETTAAPVGGETTAAPVAAETTAVPVAAETTAAPVAAETTAAVAVKEEVTTAASEEETTTALAVIKAPVVTAAVIPEITEISSETVSQGADQVVEDAETAIAALQDTKESVEISSECSLPLEEIKELVVDLARKVKSSTPILTQILTIGKHLRDINDTATLLRSGGELLKLLEPFLENILPSTSLPSCGEVGSNAMLLSLSNVASEVDIVANTVENVESGQSSALHEAATSLQLAAWILAQLQRSVHTFYYHEGICNGKENGSTTLILKSLAKAMESYKPMVAMLGPQTGVEELEDTVASINRAVAVLESLKADQQGGLPGVSCHYSLAEMGQSLEKLADFVNNLSTI